MIVELVIVVALILLNAFFAMSELALVSARRARLQNMADQGHRGARAALALAEDPNRLLSTVQVGITLIGIFAGVFVEAEREMIDGVLRLADRSVRSIMTPRHEMVWIDLEDSPDEIRRTIAESGCSRFPVARGELDEIQGVVQTKDMLDRMLGGG